MWIVVFKGREYRYISHTSVVEFVQDYMYSGHTITITYQRGNQT